MGLLAGNVSISPLAHSNIYICHYFTLSSFKNIYLLRTDYYLRGNNRLQQNKPNNSRRADAAVVTDAISTDEEDSSTTVSRSTSVETVVNNLSPEEKVAEIAWKLFKLKESKLKADLHVEFLNIYLSEYIFPKGLTILKPKVRRQKETFLKKWSDLMDDTSKKATALLEEYWKDEQKELKTEVEKADNEMKNLLGDEEKDTHDKDMQEILKSKEEELRKWKEKSYREIENYIANLSQIATEHIRKKLEGTKPKSRISTQENISDMDEESDNQTPVRRGSKQGKSPIFVKEDQRSANLKAEENTALKGIGPDWKTD